MKLIRKFTTSSPQIVSDFVRNYPIKLGWNETYLGSSPSEYFDRRGYFEDLSKLSWFERFLMMPFRLRMAAAAGKSFINARFGSGSSFLAQNEQQAMRFFPTEFTKGVEIVLPLFVEHLNEWNGVVTEDLPLAAMLTPELLAAFSKRHMELDNNGFMLRLDLEPSHEESELVAETKHIWISFGRPENVTSTLLCGNVDSIYENVAFFRRVNSPVSSDLKQTNLQEILHLSTPPKTRELFREICFEYIYRPGDAEEFVRSSEHSDLADVPDFQWKRKLLFLGQKIGVDCVVQDIGRRRNVLKYEIVRKSDGQIIAEGSSDFTEGRPLRMESSHFTSQFPDDGKWQIADIDNFFIYPRVLEEEDSLLK